MSNTAIGHIIGTVPMVNYTGQRVFDLYPQPPQFQTYNQNLPMDMSNIANQQGNMQTIPYMPNFQGHTQNSANTPFRNGNIPLHINPYNVPVTTMNFNEGNHHTKSPPDRQNHHQRHPPTPNQLSVNRNDKKFAHRDEIGHGWGGGGGSVGNSPAISALALLGFLFFLNLIQNSLQNNRMMLTTTTTTTTSSNMTTSTTAGGQTTTTFGRSGRERRKRDSDYYSLHRFIPDSIPSHPIRPIQHFLENNEFNQPSLYQPIIPDSTSTFQFESQPSQNSNSKTRHPIDKHFQSRKKKNSDQMRLNALMPLMKRMKRISTNCFQLFACTLGRGIIKKYGKPTALKIRSIGRQLLPKTRTHWSTKVLRALTNGWKIGRKCSMQYNKCTGDWDKWLESSQHHKK